VEKQGPVCCCCLLAPNVIGSGRFSLPAKARQRRGQTDPEKATARILPLLGCQGEESPDVVTASKLSVAGASIPRENLLSGPKIADCHIGCLFFLQIFGHRGEKINHEIDANEVSPPTPPGSSPCSLTSRGGLRVVVMCCAVSSASSSTRRRSGGSRFILLRHRPTT
jgi:hypothetical protein